MSTLLDIHALLKQYWGYDSFRPLQEEIIRHVLAGKDALALLPTGGGKSICFQVPALAMEGLCIVISPLIALMKDQVEQLRRRGINAVAVYSGMSAKEIDIALDNCIYATGNPVRFLYLSPERLQTEVMQSRAPRMRINLLAIDEAHCISQWGYDFRPPYLEIARFRQLIGMQVPCLALTATATPEVQQDIQEKLLFRPGSRVFRKSFLRDNLSYSVFQTEDISNRLLRVLKGVSGTAIVYSNTRRQAEQIAQWLKQHHLSTDFYHAGLSTLERTKRQEAWINNRTRIIVATNAFGMGIDKPDVRLVVHLAPPTSPEAYYQEAGRGGRDGKHAYAVLLYQPNEIQQLSQIVEHSYPSEETLAAVYHRLANYLQIPVGSQPPLQNFNLEHFLQTCHAAGLTLGANRIFQALCRLEELGLLQLSNSEETQDKFFFQANYEDVYRFQVAHTAYEPLLKYLVRTFGGEAFARFVPFSIERASAALKITPQELIHQMEKLEKQGLICFSPARQLPQIQLLTPRMSTVHFRIDRAYYQFRRQQAQRKAAAMQQYLQTYQCRQEVLLAYFGETLSQPCGICDNCLKAKKNPSKHQAEHYKEVILRTLSQQPLLPEELLYQVAPLDQELFTEVVRQLLATNLLTALPDGRLAVARKS